jgi:hypothetical protein
MTLGRQRKRALLGVFAILLQAILFGWHEHPLPVSAGHQPVLRSQGGAAPLSPSLEDEHCQICIGLHHLSAAPGEFMEFAPPPRIRSQKNAAETDPVAGAARLAFHARAPPGA